MNKIKKNGQNGNSSDAKASELDYTKDDVSRDNTIFQSINPDKDKIDLDESVEFETISGVIEEILKRKQFWEKYSLLKGLEVRYGERFEALKRTKVIRKLIKQTFNIEDLAIIEGGEGSNFDLAKVEGLVQIVKNERIKEDIMRGAVPLLLSDKENESFSIFYLAAKKMSEISDARIIASCIEGMLFMINELEKELDRERLDRIRGLVTLFIGRHKSPIDLKKGFDYAKEMKYGHLMMEMVKYSGRMIREANITNPKTMIDFVRAIDLDVDNYADVGLDMEKIVLDHLIKELIVCGKIRLACKLAQRYGITRKPENKAVFQWLLSVYEGQNGGPHDSFEVFEQAG